MKKLIICAAALILSGFAFAAPDSNTVPRFAFVLGNQKYKESPLKNTISDAKLISDKLRDSGFDVTYRTDLDTASLREEIGLYSDKVNACGKDSISVIYYSGHGVQVNGVNYLVPIDDEKITTQSMVRAKCLSIKEFLNMIPSRTQVVILDACRNNPFKGAKENFAKGLTSIEAPANVDFCYLFSTAQGQTAADGTGSNSLFTTVLANRMGEMNVDVTTVFNEVCNDVKEKTGGQQVPNFSGNSVRFQFMNSQVAKARIDRLNQQMKNMDAAGKTGSASEKRQFDTDKSLMEAEITIMKEKEKKARDDKAKRDKIAADKAKENKFQAEELAKAQKSLAQRKKDAQALKAKNQTSIDFINSIEKQKQELQTLRNSTAQKINAANDGTRAEEARQVRSVNERPAGITDKDAKGNLTSAAKKARKAEIADINLAARAEEQKNFDTFYSKISEAEGVKKEELEKDLGTLKTAVYIASSITDETKYSVGNYDGEKFQWELSYEVRINSKFLFSGKIQVPYVNLAKAFGEEVPSGKLTTADANYKAICERLHALLHSDGCPLIVEVAYKVHQSGQTSTYVFEGQNVTVSYFPDSGETVQVCTKGIGDKCSMDMNSSLKMEEVSSIVKNYTKLQEKAAKESAKRK